MKQFSKAKRAKDKTRSFHLNPKSNVHACKRKSAINVNEHASKSAGTSMKVVGNFAGKMQQAMNTMKIFKIFIKFSRKFSKSPEMKNTHSIVKINHQAQRINNNSIKNTSYMHGSSETRITIKGSN